MKTLFNNDWYFTRSILEAQPFGLEYKPVQLPHDWLIYDTENLYHTSFGHYRKFYDFGKIAGRSIRLYFEGVYMDSTVFVNGQVAFDWKYGYSSFEADITPYLHDGENKIAVLVRHRAPNTRWYSGAGIFRDVWLIDTPASHLATDGVYFHADQQHAEQSGTNWNCKLSAEVVLEDSADKVVEFTLRNGAKTLFTQRVPAQAVTETDFTLTDIGSENIWDIELPNLLTLETRLLEKEADTYIELDQITQKVGLRDIQYTPDHGFYLNGRNIKLNGVCLHHDLGCLGAAFHKAAARRQLASMQEMGVNAIRTSHNMPAVGLMELCDEMGILVDNEAYDMWERSKTEFDNARFFDDWYERDVASWIRRDRNHPSVIMWSIGNEIYDTHVSPRGCEVAKLLHTAVRKHDPLKNAPTTIGSNYMPWEGAQNCAREVDLVGYNYGEYLYAEHHEKNPNWLIYGSETTSGVKSRGVYHFPRQAAYLTHEDLQCSSLGNCRAGISADTPQKIIALNRDCDYCAGMFIWTGSDYIGEPSPYSTKNSYYGCIDTAGLKKDIFYLNKAAWGKEPVLHLMPYWDFNNGQLIDIVAYTNLDSVELFVNGKSLGVQTPQEYTAVWNTPYEKGEICVVGKTADGQTLEDSKHSFGDSAAIQLACAQSQLLADGEDIAVVEISTIDADGYSVENARDRIEIQVENGRLLGYDNGDSTDYDPYKCASRKLFSGKAAAYIATNTTSGPVKITASGVGLTPAVLTLDAVDAPIREGISCVEDCCKPEKSIPVDDRVWGIPWKEVDEQRLKAEVPVRKIELVRSTGMMLTPDSPRCIVQALIQPANATYSDLNWSIVTSSGIETNLATIEVMQETMSTVALHVIGDGSFRLRCSCTNGKPQAEVISEYEFTAQGFGQAYLDPYHFLPGCLHNDSISTMDEVSKGGVSIKPDNNIVGFTKTDFGKYGTDKFLVRIINWHKNDAFDFRLWLGKPGAEGSKKLGSYTYQADFIWQTYQDNHYELPYTLTGPQDLYFEFDQVDLRIDFGGFAFQPRLKAYEKLAASDYSLIHGDNYTVEGDKITKIGNNVFIDFEGMDFANGTAEIRLTGRTRHDNDSVHVHFVKEVVADTVDANTVGTDWAGDSEEVAIYQEIIEVPYSDDYITITKPLPDIRGLRTVKFQFLPGCDFDFVGFEIVPK